MWAAPPQRLRFSRRDERERLRHARNLFSEDWVLPSPGVRENAWHWLKALALDRIVGAIYYGPFRYV